MRYVGHDRFFEWAGINSLNRKSASKGANIKYKNGKELLYEEV